MGRLFLSLLLICIISRVYPLLVSNIYSDGFWFTTHIEITDLKFKAVLVCINIIIGFVCNEKTIGRRLGIIN